MTNLQLQIEKPKSERLLIAHRALSVIQTPKPFYYVEDATIVDDYYVKVEYFDENTDEWNTLTGTVRIETLANYIENNYRLGHCIYLHEQPLEFGTDVNQHIFFQDNLRTIVKYYLNDGKGLYHA